MCSRVSASTRCATRYRPMRRMGDSVVIPTMPRRMTQACRNGLVAATDVDGVRDLLRCSTATAYTLTERARGAAERARDQQIADLKAEGKSEREIARDTGLPKTTVHRRLTN